MHSIDYLLIEIIFLFQSQSNFPHFKKEQLIDFERRFLLKISFQIVPQTTPSAFVRYLLDLWPRHNDGMNKFNNNSHNSNNSSNHNGNGNSRFFGDRHVPPQIPYMEILAIADNLMGLFWEGTYRTYLHPLSLSHPIPPVWRIDNKKHVPICSALMHTKKCQLIYMKTFRKLFLHLTSFSSRHISWHHSYDLSSFSYCTISHISTYVLLPMLSFLYFFTYNLSFLQSMTSLFSFT